MSTSFKEIVQKVVNVEAKAGLRSSIMVRHSDIRCLRGKRLSNNTFSKVQNQETTIKETCAEESKPKEAKSNNSKTPIPPRSNEPIKPNRKKKKREWLKKKGLYLGNRKQCY